MRLLRIGLADIEILLLADLDASLGTGAVLLDLGRHVHHLAIEARDALGGAGAHVEADIGHAKLDPAEALDVRRVHGDAVAPRAYRFDAVIALAEIELGAFERLL